MKRNLVVWIMSFFLLAIGACGTESEVKEPEEGPVVSGISAGYFESDGILEPMDVGELIEKLSRLKEGMPIEDVIGVFGKEPFTVIESNSDIYEYYSGDITIRLWGKELYIVEVEYGESWIRLELWSELPINEGGGEE